MTDKDKVFIGIGQHINGSMWDRCEDCPYYSPDAGGIHCRDALLEDMYELIGDQAPRVLTLEELPGHDGAAWVEYSPAHLAKAGEWMFVDFVPTYMQNRSVYLYTRRGQMVSYAQYGVTWRAWTGRPSEEQRETEKWEDSAGAASCAPTDGIGGGTDD